MGDLIVVCWSNETKAVLEPLDSQEVPNTECGTPPNNVSSNVLVRTSGWLALKKCTTVSNTQDSAMIHEVVHCERLQFLSYQILK
jgi:hypothetical protein